MHPAPLSFEVCVPDAEIARPAASVHTDPVAPAFGGVPGATRAAVVPLSPRGAR